MAKPSRKAVWRDSGFFGFLRIVLYALLISGAFRAVAYQPFSIPSGSMKPVLLVGDFLFVSKYAYGYSRHSLPFSPPLPEGRWLDRTPERGDIAVFKLPRDDKTDYIKRLIGLPGDHVQLIRGVLHLNGRAVPREPAGEFLEPYGKSGSTRCLRILSPPGELPVCVKARYRETLPNGRSYYTLSTDDDSGYGADNTPIFVIPEGHYFFLGDNRDNSVDSRFASGVGMVPESNLVGRGEVIFLSTASRFFALWDWRFSRFFKALR